MIALCSSLDKGKDASDRDDMQTGRAVSWLSHYGNFQAANAPFALGKRHVWLLRNWLTKSAIPRRLPRALRLRQSVLPL